MEMPDVDDDGTSSTHSTSIGSCGGSVFGVDEYSGSDEREDEQSDYRGTQSEVCSTDSDAAVAQSSRTKKRKQEKNKRRKKGKRSPMKKRVND